MSAPRKRRTNAEILEASKAAKKEKEERLAALPKRAVPRKRAPRKIVIPAVVPEVKEEEKPDTRTINFLSTYRVLGTEWHAGDDLTIVKGTEMYKACFDLNGTFTFNKTPEEQIERWGEVRYTVKD